MAETTAARPLWFALAVVALGTWAYANSLGGVFVLDDIRAIVRNPTIRTWSPLSTPLSPPTASTVAGRPVANLSFAINYALAPEDAREDFDPLPHPRDAQRPERFVRNVRGYHLANLGIHLVAALLLFGIVRRTLLTPRLRASWGDVAPWVAASVAALWVAHPLPTAAVTYLVQRVESLMGLFYLLTLYCAIRADGSRRAWAWSAASVAACALGMGTKETMVTAPLAVAAWDQVFNERRWTRPRVALLIALAATWIVTIVLLTGEQRAPSVSLSGDVVWRYLLTQSAVILHYLRLVFVPTPLAALYDWPLATSIGDVWMSLALVGALAVVALVAFVRRHPASFAGVLFFLFLAPSSSVLPIVTEVAAEHRMYVPLACVVALVVIAIVAIARRFLPVNRPLAVMGLVLVLGASVGLGAVTRARNADYASEERLWQSAVEARPSDARTRVAYGSALASAGRFADAEAQLSVAVDLSPADPVARVRLGSILARQNKLDAAGAQLERALEVKPDDVDGLRFLAEVRAIQRRDADAVALYERTLRLTPNDLDLALRLAAVLADSRNTAVRNGPRATALAEQAAQATQRQDVRALEVLAVALGSSGRYAEAAATAREAAALARSHGESRRADALEYRAVAYDYAAQQGFVPQR